MVEAAQMGLTHEAIRAHQGSIQASVPTIASALQDLFGQKLAAVMVGVDSPKAIGRWARGEHRPQPDHERTLRAVYQIAILLLQAEDHETVRAWFMGMNPYLGDRAPALVVAERPAEVLQAARAFVAGGSA
jgi:hypothetical protein